MPQLQEDPATLGMDGVRHGTPALDLLGGVDPRRPGIALALLRDLGGLGNDQCRRGTLPARTRHSWRWARYGLGSARARQWRHGDAVGRFQLPDCDGREQMDVMMMSLVDEWFEEECEPLQRREVSAMASSDTNARPLPVATMPDQPICV